MTNWVCSRLRRARLVAALRELQVPLAEIKVIVSLERVQATEHVRELWAAKLSAPFAASRPVQASHGRESAAVYDVPVTSETVSGGVVHPLPVDLRRALIANTVALDAWNDITPLARNEFICWVEDAKQATTRARRIRRTQEELEEGKRRPCCWPGCKHRERTGGA
jgi:DNA-binding transcriptional MerR regulator